MYQQVAKPEAAAFLEGDSNLSDRPVFAEFGNRLGSLIEAVGLPFGDVSVSVYVIVDLACAMAAEIRKSRSDLPK